jgi:biopolymer transport protein ExbD
MGMSVPGSSKAGRAKGFDLNLVPFIDLLSSLIAFLLMTAVWIQAYGIPHEESAGGSGVESSAPLTLHVRGDGVEVFRSLDHVTNVPVLSPGVYDWPTVAAHVRDEHAAFPADARATLVTDDGVAYKQMIAALDVTRVAGLTEVRLAGGPVSAPPPRARHAVGCTALGRALLRRVDLRGHRRLAERPDVRRARPSQHRLGPREPGGVRRVDGDEHVARAQARLIGLGVDLGEIQRDQAPGEPTERGAHRHTAQRGDDRSRRDERADAWDRQQTDPREHGDRAAHHAAGHGARPDAAARGAAVDVDAARGRVRGRRHDRDVTLGKPRFAQVGEGGLRDGFGRGDRKDGLGHLDTPAVSV